MAVIEANETWVPNPLQYTATGATFTRIWKVEVDTVGLAGAVQAVQADDIPRVGALLKISGVQLEVYGSPIRCSSVTPTLRNSDSDRYHYDVLATYTQEEEEDNQDTDNELSYNLSYSFDVVQSIVWEQIPEDGGDPAGILNSAGDPFNDPVLVDVPVLNINITDTVSNFNPNVPLEYLHSINKDQVTISGVTYKARSLMITDWSANRIVKNGVPVFQRTRKFTAAAEPFSKDYKLKILDQGFNELVPEESTIDSGDSGITSQSGGTNIGTAVLTDKKKKIRIGSNKEESTSPQLLDGNGRVLGDGKKPEFLKFNIYEAKSWGGLGIPSQLPIAIKQ